MKKKGSVVQLDRISDFGSEGWGFESSLGHLLLLFFFLITRLDAQTILSETKLPISVYETSGLEIINGNLVTINDSGNPSNLYYLSQDGELLFRRIFNDLKNNDWEDLTADEEFIYIADTGNNFDTRENLRIIKIPIDSENNYFEIINFHYPEQVKFITLEKSSQYDAEGLITIGENLIIFTKNKLKKITEIYTLPKIAGTYEAKKIGSLNIQSIITGADYDSKTKLLALTGSLSFKGDKYYIFKIKDFDPKKTINNHIDMYEIPIGKSQVESIKIIDKNNFWVTSEAETFGSPYLFKISL
tara:strand:- start:4556 stop:5458 length:903 start_codon:yes stop_codon:yes gene_type:complete